MIPGQAFLDRFRTDLDALIPSGERLALAVSGGADSLALLLLAAAVRPGLVEAATVDHALRRDAHKEAADVARTCAMLGVAHAVLTASWTEPPGTGIQERARHKRYRLLSYWAEERGLGALVTAHHADDQAETFLMRLSRGAGVRGLAAMRARSITPGSHVRLVRPLLRWRRAELERICIQAGLSPVVDPTNSDEQFERVRMRLALSEADWLDPCAIGRSAAYLGEADAALDWAAEREWKSSVHERADGFSYRPSDAPGEIVRRIIAKVVRRLATEGEADLRGRELDQLLDALRSAGVATIRGVRCAGGREWHFTRAAARRD